MIKVYLCLKLQDNMSLFLLQTLKVCKKNSKSSVYLLVRTRASLPSSLTSMETVCTISWIFKGTYEMSLKLASMPNGLERFNCNKQMIIACEICVNNLRLINCS